MKKRVVSLMLLCVMVLTLTPIISIGASAMSYSDYKTKYTAFINDSRWKNGIYWDGNQQPKTAPSAEWYGCAAYCYDFVSAVYGTYIRGGTYFSNVSEIKAGDVLHFNWAVGGEHWIVVLERSGNTLTVAEGNYGSKVRIGNNYQVSNGVLQGIGYSNCSLIEGYHYSIDAPQPTNVTLTTDKTSYMVGETATFSFSAESATHYSFVLINGYSFEEGVTAKYVVNQTAGTQTFTFTEPGIYKTWVCAFNGSSYVNSPFSYLVVGSDEPVKTAEYGNSRYELYIGKTDWESAEAFCEKKGGHLVTITSDEEWETVLRLIQEKPYSVESVWIGLADKDHDGTYSWISGEPFACDHWAEGNPSITGGKEHYTEMGVVSGEWNDIELKGINVPVTHEQHWRTSGYICEYDHLKHDYEVVSSVSPTCTEDGNINYICSECGETYTETVPALGHNFGKDGKSEKCSRCGVTNPDYKPQTGFKDVIAGEFYVEPVVWAVNNGITSGTSDTTFSPNDGCTRGQVVTFLWRSAGKPEPKISVNPFSDVKSSEYYYKAVLWAVENGITNGTSASKFSPNDTCTRGQIVTFLWRAKGSPEPKSTNNPFSDIGKKDYYFKAVLWAVGKNITLGTDKNHFSPSDTCTRAQVVTFFYRGKN